MSYIIIFIPNAFLKGNVISF